MTHGAPEVCAEKRESCILAQRLVLSWSKAVHTSATAKMLTARGAVRTFTEADCL